LKLFGVRASRFFILLYTLNPFNLIHDVVGFLDPGVGLVASASFYFLLKYIDNKDYKFLVFIGIILGLGTLIRESAFYFIILIPITIILIEIFYVTKKQYIRTFAHIILMISIIYPIYSIKRLTPLSYPQIKPIVENHYLFTDFLTDPFKYLGINLYYYTQVIIGYSALLLFLFIMSLFHFKKLNYFSKIVYLISVFWACTPILGALLFASLPSSRYIIASFPFIILAICSNPRIFPLISINGFLRSKLINVITIILTTLMISQTIFMTIKLENYTLPGLDDWQYFRAQQLSGSGLQQIVDKVEFISIEKQINSNPIKVLGVNSYNNGILAVLLNRKTIFTEKQIDIFGFYNQPLVDFDFILIEEGNVGTYISWGWPLAQLTKSKEETQLLPLSLDSNFYSELNVHHERVFEYTRPRNGASVVLYTKK
jgi:hypothetical protein